MCTDTTAMGLRKALGGRQPSRVGRGPGPARLCHSLHPAMEPKRGRRHNSPGGNGPVSQRRSAGEQPACRTETIECRVTLKPCGLSAAFEPRPRRRRAHTSTAAVRAGSTRRQAATLRRTLHPRLPCSMPTQRFYPEFQARMEERKTKRHETGGPAGHRGRLLRQQWGGAEEAATRLEAGGHVSPRWTRDREDVWLRGWRRGTSHGDAARSQPAGSRLMIAWTQQSARVQRDSAP